MFPLDEIRSEARRLAADAFLARHPDPILLARATVEGDLQFADPGAEWAEPRPGNTMVHLPRLTAAERLAEPTAAGSAAVEPQFFRLRPEGPEPHVTIGRQHGNALRITDWTVSASHARVHVVPGTSRAFVEDLGSRNGTAHNGVRLPLGRQSELLSGDEVQVGRWVFVFLDAIDFRTYLIGAP